MRRVFGPRTVVEAAFLVAVPVAAAVLGAGMWTIIAASAVGYLLIVVLEATLGREGAQAPGRPRLWARPRTVTVKQPEPAPSAELESVSIVGQPAVAGHEVTLGAVAPPQPAGTPQAELPLAASTPSEHVRVLRPEPVPGGEGRPEPETVPGREPDQGVDVVRRYLAAVPLPVGEPEPAAPEPAAPEPRPERSTVVPIGVGSGPRRWNLWDLERLTRESGGDDIARDEERQFLLMYLREFADADGLLPVDFDGLVRDSFGELVGSS